MIQSLIHTTENGNLYIYDDESRLSLLVHPDFEKASNESIDADEYYVKKYNYLKEHGFFAKSKLVNFETMTESMVKENFIQTQQIGFEVTDFCNLSCTYCGYGELYHVFDEIHVHERLSPIKTDEQFIVFTFWLVV